MVEPSGQRKLRRTISPSEGSSGREDFLASLSARSSSFFLAYVFSLAAFSSSICFIFFACSSIS
jgi:hypothetical protein